MDEHTLNDLLECSVCLERLDTTSKVLPCQHTFCRKCLEVSHNNNKHIYIYIFHPLVLPIVWSSLPFGVHCAYCIPPTSYATSQLNVYRHVCHILQNIVASHNELRCPECRVLIEIKIDDLPPNVLLMRILGGKIYIYNKNIFNNKYTQFLKKKQE